MSAAVVEESEEGQNATGSKATQSKSQCEVCQEAESKYKCPRCLMKTCSLKCCNKHKADTNCNGQEDRVKYVDKAEFDEKLLLNDYRFLEEQARIINSLQRRRETLNRKASLIKRKNKFLKRKINKNFTTTTTKKNNNNNNNNA